jgi:hypothetical protein
MDAGYWDTFPSRQGRKGHDEKHFDDCGFDEGEQWIRDQYALMPKALLELRLINEVGREAYFPLGAATLFGRILHPAQDFYSHSNWVELGFPLGDDESTGRVEVTQSDLVDLSGAQSGQSSLVQQWYAPNYWGAVVRHDRLRGDILLDYDDADFIPGYLAISTRAFTNSPYVPVVYDYVVGPGWPNIKGRLLISAHSPGENECNVRMIRQSGRVDEYDGPSHNSLNKDGPKSSPYDPNDPSYQVQLEKYRKAYALAALQTGYEWCRLVHEAHVADRDGVLLAMWVRAGSNPHPAERLVVLTLRGPNP